MQAIEFYYKLQNVLTIAGLIVTGIFVLVLVIMWVISYAADAHARRKRERKKR